MDYQSKKDVNVAAEQAKMDAKLAQERAEEAKERGAEASAHSGDSIEKESATCRQCRQRKSYGSNQHCEGKSHRNEPYRTGEGSTSQRQNKRNDGLIHPVKCN